MGNLIIFFHTRNNIQYLHGRKYGGSSAVSQSLCPFRHLLFYDFNFMIILIPSFVHFSFSFHFHSHFHLHFHEYHHLKLSSKLFTITTPSIFSTLYLFLLYPLPFFRTMTCLLKLSNILRRLGK